MAHEISVLQDGTAEAAYALVPAWHGLGQVLDHVPTSEEMILAAHLDWQVAMLEMHGTIPASTVVGGANDGAIIPERKILSAKKQVVRLDTGAELGVVGPSYGMVQNRKAFEFLDSLMENGAMEYEAAGALRGGSVVWVLARMPSIDQIAELDNGKSDDAARYVLFSTSHDGSQALYAIPTHVRVVCANTLRLATTGISGIRHIGDMSEKLDFARKYVSQFDAAFTLFRDNARRLAETKTTDEAAAAYIAELFPVVEPKLNKKGKLDTTGKTKRDNMVAKVTANHTNIRNTGGSVKGTWWSLYNAVSEYADHQATFKGLDADGNRTRNWQENRMMSALDGDGANFKDEAFTLALTMAGVASK